jgi:hypothetical protein
VFEEKDLSIENILVCKAFQDLYSEESVCKAFEDTLVARDTNPSPHKYHIYTLIRKILLRLTFQ